MAAFDLGILPDNRGLANPIYQVSLFLQETPYDGYFFLSNPISSVTGIEMRDFVSCSSKFDK